MRFQPVLLALGILLMLTGGAMLPCALTDIITGEPSWSVFGLTALCVIGIGGVITIAASGQTTKRPGSREAFLLTVLAWLVLPLAAAFPFMALGFSFTDAYFEAVSGLTTTGATIMTGLDTEQKGLLLWRSILQWIGGGGIIVTAIAILPALRVGGMQLFQTESSDVSGKFLPSVSEIATQITLLYIGLTVACGICYALAGMTPFDAVNHAMTTMSAGGYSTSDQSIGKYQDLRIIEICIVFMILAAMPFGVMVLMMHGRWFSLVTDPQPRFFLFVVFGMTALLIVYLFVSPQATHMRSDPHVFRDTLFSVLSVITGTGYAVNDYGQWGSLADIVFVILMFIGGCAGSAACGMNVFRIEIMGRTMVSFIKKMLSPHRVTIVHYGGKRVAEDVLQSVMIFVFLYLLIFATSSLLLTLAGLDTLTAYSSAATALSNVGPGMGPRVGPASTFQGLNNFAKWVMTFNMIFGRLEILPVFVVLTPRFWRW